MVNVNIKIDIPEFDLAEISTFISMAIRAVNIKRPNFTPQTYSQGNLFAIVVKHKNDIRVTVIQKP